MVICGVTCVGIICCAPFPLLLRTDHFYDCDNDLQYWDLIFHIFNMCVAFVLPFTITAMLNGAIAWTMWRSRKLKRKSTTASTVPGEDCSGYSAKDTKMLLLLSTVVLCLKSPFYSLVLYYLLFEVN